MLPHKYCFDIVKDADYQVASYDGRVEKRMTMHITHNPTIAEAEREKLYKLILKSPTAPSDLFYKVHLTSGSIFSDKSNFTHIEQ